MSQSTPKSDAATFTLHGKRYRLDRLLTHAGAAPTITPKVGEMNLRTNPIEKPNSIAEAQLAGYQGPAVFYPYEGKYLLLVGYDRVTEELLGSLGEDDVVDPNKAVRGKLISKQLLKKCLEDGQEFVSPGHNSQRTEQQRSIYDDRNVEYGNGRGYEDRGYRDDYRQPAGFQSRPAHQSSPAPQNTMRDQLSNLALRPMAHAEAPGRAQSFTPPAPKPAVNQPITPNRPSFSKPDRPAFRARTSR